MEHCIPPSILYSDGRYTLSMSKSNGLFAFNPVISTTSIEFAPLHTLYLCEFRLCVRECFQDRSLVCIESTPTHDMARRTTRRGPAGLSGRVQALLADQVLVTAAQLPLSLTLYLYSCAPVRQQRLPSPRDLSPLLNVTLPTKHRRSTPQPLAAFAIDSPASTS